MSFYSTKNQAELILYGSILSVVAILCSCYYLYQRNKNKTPQLVVDLLSPTSSIPDDRPIIAVDMDEVLCQYIECNARFVNNHKLSPDRNHPKCDKWQVSDFDSYMFNEVWGGTLQQTTDIVQAFLKSDEFLHTMKPIDNAFEVLNRMKSKFRFVICTSRQSQIMNETIEWINIHFPYIFDDIRFGNHFGLHGEKVSKPDMCKLMNAKVLIDDNSSYAEECCLQMDVILFDWNLSYGWSKESDGSIAHIADNVHRLKNWMEIELWLNWYSSK